MSAEGERLVDAYQAELAEISARRKVDDARRDVLLEAVAAVRRVIGIVTTPGKRARPSSVASGTKAIILDVLADGEPWKAAAIADAARVKKSGRFNDHLNQLVDAGDVVREGASRSTVYRLAPPTSAKPKGKRR